MSKSVNKSNTGHRQIGKTPTGIYGLDQITGGGLPTGRPTLICGGTGCGKTLMSMEFLIRGALEFNETGVFMAFEEKAEELAVNVASLGFDLIKLQKQNKIRVDYVHVDRSEIQETGEYDLGGLFIRLEHAIDTVGAKRVVLDTVENIFAGLTDERLLRAELKRLFQWLKDKGVTAIITGEKGEGALTRHGLEEYVSDCVLLLENRVINQVSTRLLRIVKYRGSVHGTNEYPFLIDEDGISVLPITSLKLDRNVSTKRVSTGIPTLDQMLGGQGFFVGSSILVSGTAGTGKTSIAAYFAHEACKRNEKCVFFSFEESPQQIIRNMRSIGINLNEDIEKGNLVFHSSRPTLYGLEMHLVAMHKIIRDTKPTTVVLDPITNLITMGSINEVKSMLIRLIDFLQSEQITVMFTALTIINTASDQTDESVSSIVDSWLMVRDIESNGERNRGMYIMKSRGMKHSNQVREFVITSAGLSLIDVYLGPEGVLIGSARTSRQLEEKTGVALKTHAVTRKERDIERKKTILESKIMSLNEEFEAYKEDINKSYIEEQLRKDILDQNREEMRRKRIDASDVKPDKKKK